MAQNDFTL